MPAASYWPLPVLHLPAPVRAPELTEDDFLVALQNLLPRGRAWPRDADANLTKLLRGFAKSEGAAHGREIELLTDSFPATAIELLPEWESSLGLPDPCAGAQSLLSERQAQIVARLVFAGGQSVPYFVGYALQLGYPITITEYKPRRFGDRFEAPLYDTAWAYHWQVNAPTFTVTYRRFGDVFEEPYAAWGNTVLQCELGRFKPGQTTLSFQYS